MKQRDDFGKRLLETFRVEAEDRVKVIVQALLQLEQATGTEEQSAPVETLFREVHSLKGAARAVSATPIEELCATLEDVFSRLKKRSLQSSSRLLNALHRAVDTISALLVSAGTTVPFADSEAVDLVVRELKSVLSGRPALGGKDSQRRSGEEPIQSRQPEGGAHSERTQETVRIAVAKLDALRLQAEEMLSFKLSEIQRTNALRALLDDFLRWKQQWDRMWLELRAVERARERSGVGNHTNGIPTAVVEFFDRSNELLRVWQQQLRTLAQLSLHDQRSFSLMLDNLVNEARQAQMFPVQMLLEPFPKIVRDLARGHSKRVRFSADGTSIEMDRRILEALKDPLLHLIRNAVDHGIEPSEERERAGKPPEGSIHVSIAQKNGNWVELRVVDDGAGINVQSVRQAAIHNGIITEEEAARLSEQETIGLLFASGVTTRGMVTDLSGRGLGLAIVRERVEALGGRVSVTTTRGLGTTFSLLLPLTLATFRGIVVSAGDQQFIVPVSAVERTLRFRKQEVHTIEGKETITVNGESVALVWLGTVLGLPQREYSTINQALVLTGGGRRLALAVDLIEQEQEVLVKPLGPQLVRVRNIAGATVLGSGRVVPILNVADLMLSALQGGVAPEQAGERPRKRMDRPVSVLVVEDSITARTLLKGILEGVGYRVTTAVDGVDALTQLRTGEFDIVVSDVDMPRMNGFELTARIRSDRKLGDLPVVLVTALDSREDRERGVEAGANAYIVKSSFDQSNLLETVQRLVG